MQEAELKMKVTPQRLKIVLPARTFKYSFLFSLLPIEIVKFVSCTV